MMLQDIKNGVSNFCFVKIKNFRWQASKSLGNRRKTYVLDVICNKFYFGEAQVEEVLGQCTKQVIGHRSKVIASELL